MTSTWTRPVLFVCALVALATTAFAVGGTPASCTPAALACAGADTPLWLLILLGLVLLAGIGLVGYALWKRRAADEPTPGRRDASQK